MPRSLPDSHDIALPPNAEQLINALRQIGYSFEQAVSDLLDNCINAKARKVLVRLVYDDHSINRLLVVDNGIGMTKPVLDKAMRFGAHEESGPLSLGKFGMGMKLASISHAKTLTVCTVSGGMSAGRRWTVEGVSRNWVCEAVPAIEAKKATGGSYGDVHIGRSGTVVEWSRIDRLSKSKNGPAASVEQLIGRLRIHLGLHFHRFLESKRLQVILDAVHQDDDEPVRPIEIEPLNPFGYENSGSDEYPKTFEVEIPDVGKVEANAHIWPPNSKSKEHSLGGRASSRQGFYFYRNDRLIQAGGWNGLVQDEAEPHGSLARVSIELPISLDESFGLNVQKSLVNVPNSFAVSVTRATTADNVTFSQYRKRADEIYRKKDDRARADFPLSPAGGLPSELVRKAKVVLGGGKKVREVQIVWSEADGSGNLFWIDRENCSIHLDRSMRKPLLAQRSATKTDLPLVKLLFFLLLEDDVDSSRLSSGRKQKLVNINDLLKLALQHERKAE